MVVMPPFLHFAVGDIDLIIEFTHKVVLETGNPAAYRPGQEQTPQQEIYKDHQSDK